MGSYPQLLVSYADPWSYADPMEYPMESCGGAGDIIGVGVPLYGEAPAAFLAAYKFASSWALPMFFLYLILLFPNQLDTCQFSVNQYSIIVRKL